MHVNIVLLISNFAWQFCVATEYNLEVATLKPINSSLYVYSKHVNHLTFLKLNFDADFWNGDWCEEYKCSVPAI